MTHTHRLASISLIVTFTALLIDCTSCPDVQSSHEQFLTRSSTATTPHLQLEVPFALANRLIAERIGQIKPIQIKMPNVGAIAQYLGQIEIAPCSCVLEPARDDHVGFRTVLEARYGGVAQFEIVLVTEVKPEFDSDTGMLEIGISADSFRSVTPQLSPNAQQRLADAILNHLPREARLLVTNQLLQQVTAAALAFVVENLFELIRDNILVELGEITRLHIKVPRLPVRSIGTRSVGGAHTLLIEVVTWLPVTSGLDSGVQYAPVDGEALRIRLSMSTAAELGNWGMAHGLVPQQYDSDGKPTEEGGFVAGLDWGYDARPLKVHLWSVGEPCVHVTIGGTPDLYLEGDHVQLNVADGVIEDVMGPADVVIGAFFYRLWADALTFSMSTASSVEFELAGRQMNAVIQDLTHYRNELIIQVVLR